MKANYLLRVVGILWISWPVHSSNWFPPRDIMVDVTNEFGICILQIVGASRENTAFSPYGLVSVAVLLYEGSNGPSSSEIHDSLRLPWDREATRIGFRDLHRYLKSYFTNDGFLRGLVLSRPNVSLKPSYVNLLQFYGFQTQIETTTIFNQSDDGTVPLTTLSPGSKMEEEVSTTTKASSVETTTTPTTTNPTTQSTVIITETTTLKTEFDTTTEAPTTQSTTEPITNNGIVEDTEITTELPTTTTETIKENNKTPSLVINNDLSTTTLKDDLLDELEKMDSTTMEMSNTTPLEISIMKSTVTKSMSTSNLITTEMTEKIDSTTESNFFFTLDIDIRTDSPSDDLIATIDNSFSNSTTQATTITSTTSNDVASELTSEMPEVNTEASDVIMNNTNFVVVSEVSTTENPVNRKKRYIDQQAMEHRDFGHYNNWLPRDEGPRWDYPIPDKEWFFTLNGGESVPVLTYTAYLPFSFIPSINALAIQLPLDDPRYFILILLPEERFGLSKMLYTLQWCPINKILDSLKITAIYAVVPTFTVVKHINLVPAMSQMRIRKIFDPFRADLSRMTDESHLFVRTIEQVVTVSLRKYYHNHRWFDATPNEIRQHFNANHPFAYFVIDKETRVTLMAGTIVNPVSYNQK